MSGWVIDASVLCKTLVPEPLSGEADRLVLEADKLYAPDILLVEVANVMWKHTRRGQIDATHAQTRLMQASLLDVNTTPVKALIYPALELALETGRAVYDCCYLALAKLTGCPCVTADEKLVNALAGTSYAGLAVSLARV